jgi:hypothetical protein
VFLNAATCRQDNDPGARSWQKTDRRDQAGFFLALISALNAIASF